MWISCYLRWLLATQGTGIDLTHMLRNRNPTCAISWFWAKRALSWINACTSWLSWFYQELESWAIFYFWTAGVYSHEIEQIALQASQHIKSQFQDIFGFIWGVKRCNCWVNYCHSKFVAACRCLLTICDVFGHKLFKVENSREFANCIWEELSRGVVEEQILPAECQRHQNWGCKLEEERSLDWLSVFYIRVACHWFFTSFPSMPCYIMNLLLLNNTNLPF